MITIEQCRAARGLLGWTQADLAQASGLSKTAINNFEMGRGDVKQTSLEAMRHAFEREQIEFIEGCGVKKQSEKIRVLRGDAAFADLLDDIVASVAKESGAGCTSEVLAMNIDDRFIRRVSPEAVLGYLQRLDQIGGQQRVLCAPGYDSVLGPAKNCRWIDQGSLHLTNMAFLYGGKIAWPLWGEDIILITEGADMYKAEKERFEFVWAHSLSPQELTAPISAKTTAFRRER